MSTRPSTPGVRGSSARERPTDSDGWETSCPTAKDGGTQHCEHWYDDAASCCWCGDDGDHVHGDHHPSLDCIVCSDRITAGLTTMAKLMEAHG